MVFNPTASGIALEVDPLFIDTGVPPLCEIEIVESKSVFIGVSVTVETALVTSTAYWVTSGVNVIVPDESAIESRVFTSLCGSAMPATSTDASI